MNSETPARTAILIDDSEVDLFIQKRYIELSSFAKEVITYSSPLKALEEIQTFQNQTDELLIFLDLNMPILSGFEVLEKFQAIDNTISSRFKIVILTSSNSQSDRRRALEFPNVIHYLSKPITIAELNAIHNMLSQKG